MGSNSSPPAKGRRREPGARDARGAAPGPPLAPNLIYGRNPVREALRGRRSVKRVLLADGGGADALERQVAGWVAVGEHRVSVQRLPLLDLTTMLGTGDHQGIGAEVDPYPYLDLAALMRSHTLLVALDNVQDPHNLGAIIRTAEGSGAGVLIPRHRAVEVTAAVVKASAGATEHAAVARVRNLADALEEAKKAGFWIYGTEAGAGSAYDSQDYHYPTCFVVGSEGEGVGRRVADMCDVMVSLPLLGKMESLNVSVTTGILLYEALRQRAGREADGLTTAS